MKPTLSSLLATARVVSIPLRTKFRGITERELMIFEGTNGAFEWSAFPEYEDEEASIWLEAALEWGFEELPDIRRNRIPVNAILPAVKPDAIQAVLSKAGSFKTLKIKVAEIGDSLENDLDRIKVAHALYPEAKLRLDANGGYSVSEALELIEKLKDSEIALEYFEQPVLSIAELAELKQEIYRRSLNTKIAADESVRKISDPLAVAKAGAADILVLKSAPLGGIKKAMAIAKESELPVVVSSAMQSSIGLAAELHFAASLENLSLDCGLGTMSLFAGDLTKDSLIPENGEIVVRRPTLNHSALDTFRAEDHREDFWIDRLKRCASILQLES